MKHHPLAFQSLPPRLCECRECERTARAIRYDMLVLQQAQIPTKLTALHSEYFVFA